MRTNSSAIDLEQGYEAVRAQALGEAPDIAPRGLALLLQAGLPAWISACPPLASTLAPSLASGRSTTLVHSFKLSITTNDGELIAIVEDAEPYEMISKGV